MKNYWPEFLLILLEIMFSALHFFEGIHHAFPDPSKAFTYIAIAQILFIGFYIALRMGLVVHTIKDQYQSLTDALKHVTQVSHLRSGDFYNDFSFAISEARNAIAISHLDHRPPSRIAGTREDQYYKELLSVVSKSKAKFRRVELASKETLQWISGMVDSYLGRPNFSLALIPLLDGNKRQPAISVQIVDDQITYLVDIARQPSEHQPRDLKITDPRFTDKWRIYYDDVLWSASVIILNGGRLVRPDWKDQLLAGTLFAK